MESDGTVVPSRWFLAGKAPRCVDTLFIGLLAAVRIPWAQLAMDATIFLVGFGAFFWFLVIRPASLVAEVDLLKQILSQGCLALNCLLLLVLEILLLTGAGNARDRRIPLLVLAGFATMIFGDILVLAYFTRGDIGGPATVMTMIVFCLMLLLMVRQGVVLREKCIEPRASRSPHGRESLRLAHRERIGCQYDCGQDGALRFAWLERQVAELLALGCVAGQGFLFAKSGPLEQLSTSTFVARRSAQWTARSRRGALADRPFQSTQLLSRRLRGFPK
ncbi:MAG: hypothetical protein NVS1B6_12590 [Steroidobacteraceae bacterium]